MPHLRLLDEVAANATQAPMTRIVDGWLAKAAPDLPFRRCNAVLPAMAAGAEPERVAAVLDDLEEWYTERAMRVLVTVSSGDARAEDLDSLLAARGYEVEAPAELRVASVPELVARGLASSRAGVQATVRLGVDEAWAVTHAAVHGDDPVARHRTACYGRVVGGHGVGALAATATVDGEVAGIGFGVVERGLLGIFGMATAPAHRRRGVGRAVVVALAEAAAERDVPRAYLQVETDNHDARVFYRDLGFSRSHSTHYRASAPASAPPA